MDSIAVIFNPNAKQNLKNPHKAGHLKHLLGNWGTVYETAQPDQIPKTAERVAQSDVDLIGICGGDGTNHLVISSLIPAYAKLEKPLPAVQLLKGGSMNTIAWGLGIRKPAEETLGELLELRRNGQWPKTVRLGTLWANDMHGFFFGNGYAVNFLHEYYNTRAESGPRRAMEITYRAIGAVMMGGDMLERLSAKFKAEVFVDDQPLRFRNYGMIMASFIEYVGIGFKPMYKARQTEGRFHVLATTLKPIQILKQIHRFYSGRPLQGKHHFDDTARSLEIRSKNPVGFTLDGELYRSDEIRVGSGPVLEIVLL